MKQQGSGPPPDDCFIEVLQMPRPRSLALDLPHYPDDDEVMRFREWCRVNKLSERTGRRVIRGPDGPDVTRLSDKLIGVTKRNNRIWQARRSGPRVQHTGIEAA
jgi:hypothetical protein